MRRVRALLFSGLAVCTWLAAPARAQVVDPGSVVRTILTSAFSPASPDPTGITYLPATGELLTCDSEVDELPMYAGVNLWRHSLGGVVNATASTSAFSNEPSGITVDPLGGRLWVGDDNAKRIYQVYPGSDGLFGTPDDVVTDLDGLVSAGCSDVKDVSYDPVHDHLFVADRTDLAICEIEPGVDGVFDGAKPTGDDVVTTTSLAGTGITAPEGIVYDPFTNSLVVADRGTRDLYQLSTGAGLLRRIHVNFPNNAKLSGVTIAPGSTNPMLRNYYVTDRGVDNNTSKTENDGRIFEVVAIPLLGNGAPNADAGLAQTIVWPVDAVNLAGTVSDDGHPYPPSVVTSSWSVSSGPGSVTFGDTSSPSTTASFSAPGSYVLQLLADDSQLTASDTVAIQVVPRFSLSITSAGPGSVTLDPPGGSYAAGTLVSVSATPNAGALFGGFAGDLAGTATPQLLSVDGDKTVSASFSPASYSLALTSTGSGTVSLSPPGGVYPPGSTVTLTAVPASGFLFGGWSGDASGKVTPLPVVMSGNRSVHAQFDATGGGGPACGIGPELVALLPVLGWLLRRRRRSS